MMRLAGPRLTNILGYLCAPPLDAQMPFGAGDPAATCNCPASGNIGDKIDTPKHEVSHSAVFANHGTIHRAHSALLSEVPKDAQRSRGNGRQVGEVWLWQRVA